MESGFFLKRIDISANQMISGDSKVVNNKHVWFDYAKSSGKGCNGCYTFIASPQEMYGGNFD